MSALVSYDSSDSDSEAPQPPPQAPTSHRPEPKPLARQKPQGDHDLRVNGTTDHPRRDGPNPPSPASIAKPPSPPTAAAPMIGPAAAPPPSSSVPTGSESSPPSPLKGSSPSSSSSMNPLHALTLPPLPNLSPVPPSPSTTPPPPTLTAKITHFLTLKRNPDPAFQQHFNARLATSSAANNPALFAKLMEYAGLDPEGKEQYGTSWGWDPCEGLPKWGYREELAGVIEKERKRREEDQGKGRERVEFVGEGEREGKRRRG